MSEDQVDRDLDGDDELYDGPEAAPIPPAVAEMTGVMKLNKDLKEAVKNLSSPREVRYLVDTYYAFQKVRIRVGNQESALTKSGEPHEVLSWLHQNGRYLEEQISSALASYAPTQQLCRWVMAQKGLAHILACALYANLDLNRAHTAGHIWRFCGLDPSSVWLGSKAAEKLVAKHLGAGLEGTALVAAVANALNRKAEYLERDCQKMAEFDKRKKWHNGDLKKAAALCPYNRRMKVVCWKITMSFNMLRNNDDAFYGKMLRVRHEDLAAKNAAGELKEKADAALKTERYKKDKEIKILKEGRMPDGWVFGTARRITVKTFLFHYYQRGRELLGLKWVKPYAFDQLGHTHFIEAPPMVK